MAPRKVLLMDPYPLGLPEVLNRNRHCLDWEGLLQDAANCLWRGRLVADAATLTLWLRMRGINFSLHSAIFFCHVMPDVGISETVASRIPQELYPCKGPASVFESPHDPTTAA